MMLVKQIDYCTYEINMTDEEKDHLRIIVTGTDNKFVTDVGSLLAYILTYSEQHWYDTVIEPPILPLREPTRDEYYGNSSTGTAV